MSLDSDAKCWCGKVHDWSDGHGEEIKVNILPMEPQADAHCWKMRGIGLMMEHGKPETCMPGSPADLFGLPGGRSRQECEEAAQRWLDTGFKEVEICANPKKTKKYKRWLKKRHTKALQRKKREKLRHRTH